MMQAKNIKYDVMGLTETRRHCALHAAYDSGEELFLGTWDSRRVGGVDVLVNTHSTMNIAFYVELEKFYKEDHTFYKVIVHDFNAKTGPRTSPEELHIGLHGLEWNEQAERLSEFIMSTKTIHGNSQFQKPPSLRWTWESPGGQLHNEMDHIIFNRKYYLTDVSVVPKFYTGSDHRLLRARFRFSRQGEKAVKFKKRSPRTTTIWDLYISLAGQRIPS
ncbi:unnamed protein product [Heligmosomoides polygyrus]|uniref:Endo/exonuclease/phosphatase domain-containing protein n=1 Tax=Heligmosomoides polygyrus TaxID=6339 RepID=A0A183FIQ2_HELPZ|nr:unnamed protein product [Heligmosomoides polygyrus]